MQEKCSSRLKVDFIISGGHQFDPALIEAKLAIKPTMIWHKGEKIGQSTRTRALNGWVLSSGYREGIDFSKPLSHVLNIVSARAREITALERDLNVSTEFALVAYVKLVSPTISFT